MTTIELQSGQSAFVISTKPGLSTAFVEGYPGYYKAGSEYNIRNEYCRLTSGDQCLALSVNFSGGKTNILKSSDEEHPVLASFDFAALDTPGDYFQYDSRNRKIAALTSIIGPAAVLPTAVREPGAWATMIAGFALVGGARRRRRRAAALA